MDRVIPLNGAGSPIRGAAPGVPLSTRAVPTRLVLLEDEALARLVARGSGRAFGVLYERYQQQLYTYCYLFLHDADDAYDALQSALTRALAALRRGERDELFRPWLFRIANHEAHALARARAASEEAIDRSVAPDLPWVQEPAEERARLAQLVSDLRELPELQRSALLMRELTGLSHQEIATALGISRLSARQAIFHARRSLEDFREGRDLVCEEVRRMLSHEDGRLLRRHVVRSHLRDCSACAQFADSISKRRTDLHAVAPVLPAALASGLLAQLAHTSGLGAGGVTAGAAGKGIGTTIAANAAKAVTVGAIALTAGAGVGAVKLIDQSRPAHRAKARHLAPAAAPRKHEHAGHAAVTLRSHAPAAGVAGGAQGSDAFGSGGLATFALPAQALTTLPASSGQGTATALDARGAATLVSQPEGVEGTSQPEVETGGGLRLGGGSHPAEETPPAAPQEGQGTGEGVRPEGGETEQEGPGSGGEGREGREGVHGEGSGEGPAVGEGKAEGLERGRSTETGVGGPAHPAKEEAPGEGHGREAPGEGHGHEAPGEGQGREAPGEGHGREAPGEGHGHEAPGEGHGREAPGEGHGRESPGEGHGPETPGEGHGPETPGEAHGHTAGEGGSASGEAGAVGSGPEPEALPGDHSDGRGEARGRGA